MIRLGSHDVGLGMPPFFAAEMSGNHNQSLDRALAMVDAAAKTGVQSFKLQTYTADTMTIAVDKPQFKIQDPKSLWHGKTLHELYHLAHTPWEWHKPIFERCRKLGLMPFSTPFDETAVDFLETLDVEFYKIASFENTDVRLIKKVASTKKPIVISTGMANEQEIEEAVAVARKAGCKDIILLKCTSTYPASPKDTNLVTIPHFREKYQVEVGLSDHTLGIGASLASIAFGAVFIERHFVLNRAEGGVDAAFSLEPHEMKQLVDEGVRAWQALGKMQVGPVAGEKESIQFRRSLYIVEDLKEGDELTERNVRAIRPGYGLAVKNFDLIIGKKVTRAVDRGTPLSWDFIS